MTCWNSTSDRETLGMVAHHAEVDNATGLGDVGGQFNGGIMIKTRKHQPLPSICSPITPQTLHYRVHGPILTSEVINSPENSATSTPPAIAHWPTSPTPAKPDHGRVFDLSLTFARESGLLQSPAVARDIAAAQAAGHSATMIMLGEAVVSTGPFPAAGRRAWFLRARTACGVMSSAFVRKG